MAAKPPASPPREQPLEGTDDVARLTQLMAWARDNGYAVGPAVIVGSVRIQIVDTRRPTTALPSDPDWRQLHGLNDIPEEGTIG